MRPRFCALIKPRDQGGTQLNTDKVLSTTIKKKKKNPYSAGVWEGWLVGCRWVFSGKILLEFYSYRV